MSAQIILLMIFSPNIHLCFNVQNKLPMETIIERKKKKTGNKETLEISPKPLMDDGSFDVAAHSPYGLPGPNSFAASCIY